MKYDHQKIEEKWQSFWESQQLFQDTLAGDPLRGHNPGGEKSYLLFAFAYPSGSGLHVGHVESKTALDIMARMQRMQGKNVYFPVGWDAFGLPAENYAIKTGVHPRETTVSAIDTFRRQIKRIGISYDWDNELATSHPKYYRWTQWIFAQLYKKGLAYQKEGMVNWCPSCSTVLANEQVVEGLCERCDSEVMQKDLLQWYFKITDYKDELISGLDTVDWPNATKQQQLNWIGKSEGANVVFSVIDSESTFEVYTTAHDTIYGCTFMAIAPEHEFLKSHKDVIKNWPEVEAYISNAGKKTELERQAQKEKTGVLVEGITLINPVNNKEVPLYVADYVLAGYGTGAIMAVPAHDERDYAFAQKYGLEVIQTAQHKEQPQDASQEVDFISYGDIKQNREGYVQVNSEEFDGQDYVQSRKGILDKLVKAQQGSISTQYKLRDWLISRQRYWGVPIPIVYDPEGNTHLVEDDQLPWTLPTDVDFKPTGESPLTTSKELQDRVSTYVATHFADLIAEKGWDASGADWRPEVDTMDTFVDSSWYYMRYCDARYDEAFAREESLDKWLPVDMYLIGPEHIVLHLLYSRFFTKFLRDEGYLKIDEPFAKMRHQGMILGPDGKKMSKSKGNVINPDEIIEKFGADTLRVYEMFMGPLETDKAWSTTAVAGVYRFLKRIHRATLAYIALQGLVESESPDVVLENNDTRRKLHQTIQKVTIDVPKLKFNTAIAGMMEFLNTWEKSLEENTTKNELSLSSEEVLSFLKILAPFAPFIAEELYQEVMATVVKSDGETTSIHLQEWPTFNSELAQAEMVTIVVQVNGKVRGDIQIPPSVLEAAPNDVKDEIIAQAKDVDSVKKWLEGKTIKKEIYVPGKIVSLVVAE